MKYKEMLKIALVEDCCYAYCEHMFRNINRESDCKYDMDCHSIKNYKHFKIDIDKFNREFGTKIT